LLKNEDNSCQQPCSISLIEALLIERRDMKLVRAAMQEGRTLLQNLGFHKIVAKVDQMNSRIESECARVAGGLDNSELRSDSQGNGSNKLFDAAPLRTEIMNKLNLPRVIVIGDEKAGKSSTLERFSMVEVLPRDVAFCTRQPVVLKLRYNPDIPQDSPRFVLTIPNDLEGSQAIFWEEFDDVVVIRGLIEERMVAIKESGKGILMDSEVIVEIHSCGVPSIDLVDLPGLISVLVEEPGEPDNLAELSELCTKKYAHVHVLHVVIFCGVLFFVTPTLGTLPWKVPVQLYAFWTQQLKISELQRPFVLFKRCETL
jgi:hypothetical protein